MKFINIVFAVLLLFAVIIMINVQEVSATVRAIAIDPTPTFTPAPPVFTPMPSTPIPALAPKAAAEGGWFYPESDASVVTVPMDQITLEAPEWMVLMTSGLQTSGADVICHPYRGAGYGWKGAIFLQNGKYWLMLPTSIAQVPDEEGPWMICAQTWVAGTYAVFGYWEKPENSPPVVLEKTPL